MGSFAVYIALPTSQSACLGLHMSTLSFILPRTGSNRVLIVVIGEPCFVLFGAE